MKSALAQLGFTIKKMESRDLPSVRLLLAELYETEEIRGQWPDDLNEFLSAERSAGVTVWCDGDLKGACLFVGNDEQVLDITAVAAAFDCCAMDTIFAREVIPLMLATLMTDKRGWKRVVRYRASDFLCDHELSERDNMLLASMGQPLISIDWRS